MTCPYRPSRPGREQPCLGPPVPTIPRRTATVSARTATSVLTAYRPTSPDPAAHCRASPRKSGPHAACPARAHPLPPCHAFQTTTLRSSTAEPNQTVLAKAAPIPSIHLPDRRPIPSRPRRAVPRPDRHNGAPPDQSLTIRALPNPNRQTTASPDHFAPVVTSPCPYPPGPAITALPNQTPPHPGSPQHAALSSSSLTTTLPPALSKPDPARPRLDRPFRAPRNLPGPNMPSLNRPTIPAVPHQNESRRSPPDRPHQASTDHDRPAIPDRA